MARYIELDALVAEIERRIESYILLQQKPEMSDLQEELQNKIDCLNSIKGYILNTLEVKETEEKPVSKVLDDAIEYGKNIVLAELERIIKDKEEAGKNYVFAFSEVKELVEKMSQKG